MSSTIAAQNLAKGKTFYQTQKDSGDYHEHEAGFLYRFITEGQTGKGSSINSDLSTKPGPRDTVEVHYKGTLIGGKEFDSSYKRKKPISFALTQVIKGWGLACQLMTPGDKIECILPENLAYGAKGAGSAIGPNETLIFVIELLVPAHLAEAKKGEQYYESKLQTCEYIEGKEKYLYKFLSNGGKSVGGDRPGPTDTVEVHYRGTLIDGTEFDSSIKRGKTTSFKLNEVVEGWGLTLQNMCVGDKVECILPFHLAYGAEGSGPIPGGATLIFEIELFSITISPKKLGAIFYKQQKDTGMWIEHPKGFLYRFIDPTDRTKTGIISKGGPKPTETTTVTTHYRGTLADLNKSPFGEDATEFDSSYKRGKTLDFAANRVIAGWTAVLQEMSAGDVVECILPPELAYGTKAVGKLIKPNSTLCFVVELVKF